MPYVYEEELRDRAESLRQSFAISGIELTVEESLADAASEMDQEQQERDGQ